MFTKSSVSAIDGNVFEMIGSKWMLITASDKNGINTMTASWGGLGVLWGKNVATCYIRPSRYTKGFVDNSDFFTLSFYGEEYRDKLALCGSKSGRDIDKVAETGFTPAYTDSGAAYFEQAELVLVCRKLYTDTMKPKRFLAPELEENYSGKDYHEMYIGEITEVLVR